MSDKVFFDTNVLIYAKTAQDASKRQVAQELLGKCCEEDSACISTQVVQEFCSNMIKKSNLTNAQISEILQELQDNFDIVNVQMSTIKNALNIKARYGFSFWDSLIVAAAEGEGCKTLYTEDLGAGQVIGEGLTIKNPFKE